MSSSNCCFLTCIQISQEAGQVVWYSYLFQNFPHFFVIHTIKGFGVVNKAEIDVFLELSWIFSDPADVGNLIPGSLAFSKSSLNIWKFLIHILLKPSLENFEHFFTSMWDECSCAVVWAFFGEGNGTPLQYSCLENPMDGGAWKAAVHGVAEGRTRLSDFTFTFHFHALEKEMATHSSVPVWRIPGTAGPGGLPSMGSHRVGHDWRDLAVADIVSNSGL